MVELFIFIVCIGIAVMSIHLKVSDVTVFVSDKCNTLVNTALMLYLVTKMFYKPFIKCLSSRYKRSIRVFQ